MANVEQQRSTTVRSGIRKTSAFVTACVATGAAVLAILLQQDGVGVAVALVAVTLYLIAQAIALVLWVNGARLTASLLGAAIAILLLAAAATVRPEESGMWALDLLAPPIAGILVVGVALLVRMARR